MNRAGCGRRLRRHCVSNPPPCEGYEVELLDRCPRLGGRAQVFERDGFRFDAGPTVITRPSCLMSCLSYTVVVAKTTLSFGRLIRGTGSSFLTGTFSTMVARLKTPRQRYHDLMRPTSKDTGDLSRTRENLRCGFYRTFGSTIP